MTAALGLSSSVPTVAKGSVAGIIEAGTPGRIGASDVIAKQRSKQFTS